MAEEFDARAFAASFCDRYTEGSVEDILRMYADDTVIEVTMREDLFPVPLPRTKPQLAAFLQSGRSKGKIMLKCKSYLVDGDRLAIEATGVGPPTEDGYIYANHYAFFLEMRDGKIVKMREYMDTLYAKEAFDRA